MSIGRASSLARAVRISKATFGKAAKVTPREPKSELSWRLYPRMPLVEEMPE